MTQKHHTFSMLVSRSRDIEALLEDGSDGADTPHHVIEGSEDRRSLRKWR